MTEEKKKSYEEEREVARKLGKLRLARRLEIAEAERADDLESELELLRLHLGNPGSPNLSSLPVDPEPVDQGEDDW